jgi:hypothetical protein
LILGGNFTPLVPAKAAIAGGEDARKRANDGRLDGGSGQGRKND